MRALLTDPCVSEFGWELMSWQGWLRAKAKDYDAVVVCSTRELLPIYVDFASMFIPHDIRGLRDCFHLRKVDNAPEWRRVLDELLGLKLRLTEQGYRVDIVKHSRSIPISEQCFIRYGNAQAARDRREVCDVLVHARHKQSRDPYYSVYNWSQEKWDEFCLGLLCQGVTVGAVGLKSEALHPRQTIDMRSIQLSNLMDAMAAARLVVGPSSGPLHLASLCGAEHVVWTGKKYSTTIQGTNRDRYERKWNPLNTKCYVYDSDPNPSVKEMLSSVFGLLKGKDCGDVKTA